MISTAEVTYIRQSCEADIRQDGRTTTGYRPYSLICQKYSPILSNSSSRLLLPGSNTDIICSIKAELVHPPFHASKGIIDLNIDILPYATEKVERKNIRKEELELTSTLSHLLLPHLIDRNKLVIVVGKYVWRLNIDLVVMHCDGSLLDACGMVIYGAMQKLRLPRVDPIEVDKSKEENSAQKSKISDELLIDGDVRNSVTLDGVDCPIIVTVGIVPGSDTPTTFSIPDTEQRFVKKRQSSTLIVDATRLEEACTSSTVSISVDVHGSICGVYKKNSNSESDMSGNLSFSMLSNIQQIALESATTVFDILSKSLDSSVQQDSLNSFFRPHIELQ